MKSIQTMLAVAVLVFAVQAAVDTGPHGNPYLFAATGMNTPLLTFSLNKIHIDLSEGLA